MKAYDEVDFPILAEFILMATIFNLACQLNTDYEISLFIDMVKKRCSNQELLNQERVITTLDELEVTIKKTNTSMGCQP